MKKSMRYWGMMFFMLMCTMILASCQVSKDTLDEDQPIKMDYSVSKDQYFDSDGNLQVPFDVAYQDAFNRGEIKYDEKTILLKFSSTFDGILTKNLKNAGISSLELTMKNNESVWYLATIKDNYTVRNVMSTVRLLDDVLVADYNYIYQTEEFDPITYPDIDISENPKANELWHLQSSKVDTAWQWLEYAGYQPGGLGSVVVAVIDTGVDYNHIDLKANMWVNTGEIPGNGIDDDENGYIDDVHGVNVISDPRYHSGDPMDDHGHGTHVAGIIAASNNKEGIVGVAYNTKIMAIKAGMQSGYFTQDSIAEAILYAYDMGADVINMSFGGSAVSIAVQDALMTAYTRAVLVAAAGNNGMPNERTPLYPLPQPSYPAALPYVIGVMSVGKSNIESPFSNWDWKPFNQIEYEIYAPGEQILSTIPNDQYATWSGTSMAAPVVSGIAALLRSVYQDQDMYPNKFIMGQINAATQTVVTCINPSDHLLHNIPNAVDAYMALTQLPKPDVKLFNYYIFDHESIATTNNGDGIIDAGETIDLGLVLRNRWGMSEQTLVTIDTLTIGGVSSPYVELMTSTVDFGNVGTYSTKDTLIRDGSIVSGVDTPLRLKITEDAPNDYVVILNIVGSYQNGLDPSDEAIYTFKDKIELTIRSGFILPNIIREDMTLTKDKYYIIPNSMVIQEGATVTVEPGTQIQFWTNDPEDPYAESSIVYLRVEGDFLVQGTEEEPVRLFPSEMMSNYRVEIFEAGNKGYVSLEYAEVTNGYLNITYANHSKFSQNFISMLWYRYLEGGQVKTANWASTQYSIDYAENSIFYALGAEYDYTWLRPSFSGEFVRNIFVNSSIQFNYTSILKDNVFLGNNTIPYGYPHASTVHLSPYPAQLNRVNLISSNPATGHSYYSVYFADSLSYDTIDAYFKSIGGQIMQLETPEEAAYLTSHLIVNQWNNSLFGIKKDLVTREFMWGDGQPISWNITKDATDSTRYFLFNEGNGFIYPSSNDRFSYAILEYSGDIYIDQIILPLQSIDLDLQSSYQLTPTLVPSTAHVDQLIYQSSDPTVATVDEHGVIQPLSLGQATIYVYSNDYVAENRIQVRVLDKVVLQDIDIQQESIQINLDSSKSLQVLLSPVNTTERNLIYSSSDPMIASVDQRGVMTAHAVGQTIIRVSNAGGTIFDEVHVSVVSPVLSIEFTESVYMTTLEGEDSAFYPTLLPVDATNKNIIWQSSNPEVAYVDDNGVLIKLQEGVTTMIATVENTTLSDEIIVSIRNINTTGSVLKMNRIELNNVGYYFALYSDGHIYYWGNKILAPKLLPLPQAVNVIDFAIMGSSYLFTVDDGGHVKQFNIWQFLYYGEDRPIYTEDFYSVSTLSNIIQITQSEGYQAIFALRSDGSVWSFGSNNLGNLGDGTLADRTKPVQVLLNDVKQVIGGYSITAFLQNDGDLYVTGSKYGYSTPTLIKTGVIDIESVSDGYYIIVRTPQNSYLLSQGNVNEMYHFISTSSKAYSDMSGIMYIDDGYVYSTGFNRHGRYGIGNQSINLSFTNYMMTIKIDQVEKLFVFDSNIFFQTSDGKFYGTGINTYHELANFSTTPSYVPVRIYFGLEGNSTGLAIESSNVINQELMDSKLVLDFNEAIVAGDQYPYILLKDSTNHTLAVTRQMTLDKLIVVPFNGWTIGETYTIEIPKGALYTKFMIENEFITYTFTYQGEQTPIIEESSNIQDGDILGMSNVDLRIEYSYALEGTLFGDIKVLNSENLEMQQVNIQLINNTLIISGELPYGDYTLHVPQGSLKDNIGGVNDEKIIQFTLEQTIVLLDSTHQDSDNRMMVDESIMFTFNTAQVSTAFDLIRLVDENDLQVPINVTLIDHVLTIDPIDNLDISSSYTIIIPEGSISDQLGNLNQMIEFTFTTYEPIQFIRSSIPNGATHINLTQTISLFFNYAEVGPNYDVIQLKDQWSNVMSISKHLVDLRIDIKPIIDLQNGEHYLLTIPQGAFKDELGVENDPIIIEFDTIDYVERFYWNYTNMLPTWRDFVEKGLNSSFTGNAVLNNFNNTNVEQWLRFQAPESSTYNRSIGLGGNYWGTTNSLIIGKHIIDFDDFQSLIDVVEGEALAEAPSDTFPFVVSVTLLNKDNLPVTTVGNELITVMVTFNRDMDQNIPLRVRFGSYLPYADYEISGSYITPHTWVGTYQLTTIIENGNQYFTIEHGAAVDDSWLTLQPDFGRFTFEIDTTEAQAMVMQGVATEEGIELTWYQDDFDTLAGYNIYRSTNEMGYYQRMNTSIIPSDTKTFFDDTVEPGVRYYYNFTVVKTDLSESEPSGKISIMSLDTMAPNIYHTPIYKAFTNSNLVVVASIIDNLVIQHAKVYYRVVGESTWRTVAMTNNNNRYSAIIQASYLTTAGLEYYIEAYDGINYTYKGSATSPYLIQVQQGVDATSLGDVNGDGVITTLDALMVLQAINGRINLNAEQFLRSDLDKNGVLEAWEALKILMYVSGKITSIV